MARPKADRRGKNLTIYLTHERLDRLGSDPAKALYALIDGNVVNGVMFVGPKTAEKPPLPAKKARKHALCDRCSRIGTPSCPTCPTCRAGL